MLRRIHKNEQGGQDANREQRPPRDCFWQNGVQASVDERCQTGADCSAGLHEPNAAAAIFVADHLTHQYRAGRPLAAEPEPVQSAQDEQLLEILCEGT